MKDLAYRAVPVVSSLPAPSSSLAGVIARLASDNKPYWCDGSVWIDITAASGSDSRITTARLGADVTNSTVTLANVTGLALSVAANTTYAIDARVMFQSAVANTGIRLTQTVPSGATVVSQWSTPISLTASTVANQRAADTGAATASIDTPNANTLATAAMLVMTGATAGSLQIRFASEMAGNSVVVKAGSALVAHRIT
jgi:hypothetical protein